MARKGIKREWVSEDFCNLLADIQRQVKNNTGRDISRAEITSVIAAMRPSINLPSNNGMNGKKKRRGTIFDF